MRTPLALALLLLAGCYSPSPESGTLLCSSDLKCPEDYSCHSDDLKCWKSTPADLFVGHWVFDSTSTVNVTCVDGSRNMSSLKDDWVDIAYPTATDAPADVTADYFCSWKLEVAAGQGTSILPGQSCPFTDSTNTAYTYSGQSFNFSTMDGKTGTLAASLQAVGAAATCTLALSGTLTNTR
jgi:hypothetical protein